jgi:DNA-binding SARP family transcriptional activator
MSVVAPRAATDNGVGLQLRPTSGVGGAARLRALLFGSLLLLGGEVGGEVELSSKDLGGVKPKQVLEVLLLARGHPVSKERLADHLWGDALPQNVSATLETYISVLRRRLQALGVRGRDVVLTEPGAYRVPADRVELDLDRFDELLKLASTTGRQQARAHLASALDLVRGEVLEDEPYASWTDAVRDTYRQRHVDALTLAAETALRDNDPGFAMDAGGRAVAADPANERACRAYMAAAYLVGSQDSALRAFDRCRRILAEEYGVQPLDATLRLRADICRHADAAEVLASFGDPD